LIVGITMAGVVILLIVLGGYLWVKRREQARQKREREQAHNDGTMEDGTGLSQGRYGVSTCSYRHC
jgi:uncharacterized iron-regulated membrane protein